MAAAAAMGDSVQSQVPFSDICSLLEKITNTKGTDKKKSVLRLFMSAWRDAHQRIHGTAKTTDSLFPAMRMLLPHLDKDRPAYGMKEVVLAKTYIEVLGIGKDSADGRKLLNYRHPTASKQDVTGDFASVAFFVLRNRCPTKGSLNVQQVNNHLDTIAKANLEKRRDDVKKTLQLLLRSTSAMEQKWLIRIILRELKTGLSENSVLSVFHPDAQELYNICNSLSKVCEKLHDPDLRMNEAEITLFSPFRPMLGQRGKIDEVENLMSHQSFYIEKKIDGERMTLHKQGDKYRYFSRSANDYTHTFGESSKEGYLSPHIAGSFLSSLDSCILDGEMVVYDPNNEIFMTKAMHVDVKTVSTYERGLQPCFVVFDILMYNGKNLANTPLKDRLHLQDKILKPRPGYIQFVERHTATSKADVVKALNDAIDLREEGIVVKAPDAVYKPNVRNGSGWLKIKPEYVDSLSDDLDVLIVGGYFGVGRRSGMVSHFLCAVAVPPDHRGQRPTHFHSFCKVGTGYTMNELKELGQQLKPHWQPFNTKKPPTSISLASGFKEKPDVFIEPSKSKIVQIKAAEITKSEKYKTGVTLRFPRLECVRDDKHWYDCLDLKELNRLKTVADGKLTSQHASMATHSEPAKKKRRVLARAAERPRAVAEHFRPADVSSLKEVSKLFEDKEFCIVNGPSSNPKASLEKMLTERGGSFTQIPGSDTYCVIADRVNTRVNNIIKGGTYDVVQAVWLIECMDKSELLPWQPSHVINASPSTAARFAEEYDCHGDSFTMETSVESLRTVFGDIECANDNSITAQEIAEIEHRYFPDNSPQGLFRRCRVYLDQYKEINNRHTGIKDCSLELTGLELRLYGAQIVQTFDERVTHVIFDNGDLSRLDEFQRQMRSRLEKHHFVTQRWVTESITNGTLLHERQFAPKLPDK